MSVVSGRGEKMLAKSGKDLRVYKDAYELAMDIFKISKRWPKEERYSLTDQIRRSSRSVCANIREAWVKRRYKAHFISKLTDSDAENSETDTWIDFALDCQYITYDEHKDLTSRCTKTGAMIGGMLHKASSFILARHN